MTQLPFLSPPSAVTRVGAPAWLSVVAALALGACSTLGQKPPAPAPSSTAPAPPSATAPQPQQTQQAPQAQQSQQAAPNPALQALLSRSDATLQLIEANRMDELWAVTAPFVQAAGPRAQLQDGIRRTRAALGAVQGRGRGGVQPIQFGPESKNPPPGQYVNVLYVAQLANGQRAVERLSFRQEGSGWLFTGYSAQPLAPQAAQQAPQSGAAPAAARR